ncbi:MAG: hypothetical protein LBD43_00895 [Holosporales bacterium]|jgi:hypothetical protein|nr:hypothetical protein [Holosporales bacterium]
MNRYIRFENGKQAEVTTLAAKPTGSDWKKAPQNFDFAKRYRLSSSGSVEEIPAAELMSTKLDAAKALALQELSRLVDVARGKYVGESAAKQKCYELQEKSANAVVDGQGPSHESLLLPLANVRNITILEMAELILKKAATANQKIIQAEAIEDEYQALIENAESAEHIDGFLNAVTTALEDF